MSNENSNKDFSTSTEVAEKKILIAPLNWGLGHAARCIPIIHFLKKNNYTPLIASDGVALSFLKTEFPDIQTIELPSYNISYSKYGFLLKWKLMGSFFSVYKAVKEEQRIIASIVEKENLVGVISDNRFGVVNKTVPSVYITHQLNVFSGFLTFFSSKFHQFIISKFDACWVPDSKGEHSLSGELIQINNPKVSISYLGNVSRFLFEKKKKKYDILILLSGPEPQRSMFEELLVGELSTYKGRVLFVRGVLDSSTISSTNKNIEFVNYLQSKSLNEAINTSEIIISRSGYSTIMDLAKLNKKAFFVPTPGQPEQEYLAKYLKQKKIAPFSKQEQFNLSDISAIKNYSGFINNYPTELNVELLRVFKKN